MSLNVVFFFPPFTGEGLYIRLCHQVDAGYKRRDPTFVERAFNHHSVRTDLESCFLPKDKIHAVLTDLDVYVDQKEADQLFDEFDTDNSDGLDLFEFQRLLQKSRQISEWAKTLDLHEILSDAIPRKPGQDPLRVVSTLTDNERLDICRAVQAGLERLLQESSASLKAAFDANDQREKGDGGSKFNLVPVSCGNVEDFHAGVEGRIGTRIPTCTSRRPFTTYTGKDPAAHRCGGRDAAPQVREGDGGGALRPLRQRAGARHLQLQGHHDAQGRVDHRPHLRRVQGGHAAREEAAAGRGRHGEARGPGQQALPGRSDRRHPLHRAHGTPRPAPP